MQLVETKLKNKNICTFTKTNTENRSSSVIDGGTQDGLLHIMKNKKDLV